MRGSKSCKLRVLNAHIQLLITMFLCWDATARLCLLSAEQAVVEATAEAAEVVAEAEVASSPRTGDRTRDCQALFCVAFFYLRFS